MRKCFYNVLQVETILLQVETILLLLYYMQLFSTKAVEKGMVPNLMVEVGLYLKVRAEVGWFLRVCSLVPKPHSPLWSTAVSNGTDLPGRGGYIQWYRLPW